MAEINLPWLDVPYLLDLKKTSEEHPDRIHYVNNAARYWRHFRSSNEWWIPMDEIDDMNLNERGAVSRNNIINRSAKELNSLILKNDPVVILHPRNDKDGDLSDTMDDILMAAWRNSGAKKVLRSATLEAQVTGMGVMKIGWNPGDMKLGREGDVVITKREYGNIWLDPYATNEKNGDDCSFIIDRTYQSPEVILALYGEKGAKALGVKLTSVGRPRRTLIGYLETYKEKFVNAMRGYDDDQNPVDRRIPVYEYWIFTSDVMYQLSTGEKGKKEVLYPYGIVVTLVDDTIVRTIENPFAARRRIKQTDEYGQQSSENQDVGHRKHPFVLDYWWRTANSEGRNGIYCCEGSVVQQVPLQYAYNKLRRNTEINTETIANPNFFYLADAIEMEETSITLGPAEGIPINPKYAGNGIQNAIQFNNGREIPAGVFQMMIDTKNDIEAAAGLKPGMVGLQPMGTSHTSGDAIGMMQEGSYSSMWAPTDELNETLYEIAFRYLGLIQQFYKEGRFIDVSDPVMGQERFVEFNNRLIAAGFNLQVVSGTTTPMYDVGRVQWQKEIKLEVDNAIASQNADMMKSCIVYLANLRLPYVANWIQLLKMKIMELTQMQEQLQQLGAMGLQSGALGMGSAPPAQLPGETGNAQGLGEGEAENTDLDAYAQEMGLTREQLEEGLSNLQ